MINQLLLISPNKESVSIELNSEKKPYAVEDILSIHCKVFDDVQYELQFSSDAEVGNITVYINGELVDTSVNNDKIIFLGENRCAFSGIIGFAQLALRVDYSDGKDEWFYSEYLSVLIKQSDRNVVIDSIIKYVYKNQADILRNDSKVTNLSKSLDNQYDDFWSQIVLIEEIATVYENSFGYFKANCRYKLDQVETLDRIEKLQHVDSGTIQYIVQHPEYFKREVTGIKHGMEYFLPSKTLMKQNRITHDIYENRVVLSFLRFVSDYLFKLKNQVSDYLKQIDIDPEAEDGYIVSSYLLYVDAKEVLTDFYERLRELENKYHNLVTSYRDVLRITEIPMYKQPEPTAIFLNIPQYNRIYVCIKRWYDRSGYDLINERIMLNFSDVPAIYEAYVLIKLINQIKDSGYTLKSSSCVTYPKQARWKYQNRNYNNTFVFSDETSELVLYYEPIIYDKDKTYVNGIGIYRNNSVSINKDSEEEIRGHYYVPDYVLKYSENGKERYIIGDAKFARYRKVKYTFTPELSYKYLTSISPVSEDSDIRGLYVFYALNDGNNMSRSFYDKQISRAKCIEPVIELVPLSENISYMDQGENANHMLKGFIGL